MPRKKVGSGSPATPKVQRTYLLVWRNVGTTSNALNARSWRTDVVEITGFIVNAAGALTLFNAGAPIRSVASGHWASVMMVGETGAVTEDAA
jgi:hypothetical protein